MKLATLSGLGVRPANAVFSHQLPIPGTQAAQLSCSTVGSNGLTTSFRSCLRSSAYENAARTFLSANGLPGLLLDQMFSYCVVTPKIDFSVALSLSFGPLSTAGCRDTAETC